MCIQFTCTGCFLHFTNHCKDRPADTKAIADSAVAFSDSETTENSDQKVTSDATTTDMAGDQLTNPQICPGPTFTTTITRCETCVRVKGAISQLHSLVYQAPFLITDGLCGLEKLEAWERGDLEYLLRGRKKSWDDKVESRAERRKVQDRIEKMGLDDAVDEREDHQGFDMSVTPPEEAPKEENFKIVW